jgi:hypothetical protein
MGALFTFLLLQLLPLGTFFFLMKWEKKQPGLAAWLVMALYLVYNLLVPVVDNFSGQYSFFNYPFPPSSMLWSKMAIVYGLGWVAFLSGYFLLLKIKKPKLQQIDFQGKLPDFSLALIALQLFFWALIFINIWFSGMDLVQIFNPENREEKNILFSANWAFPWIEMLSNCLPVCLYLHWRFSKKWNGIWIFFFISWLIFSLLAGWRYRIILFFLFMVLHFLSYQKWTWKKLVLIGLGGILVFSWLTLNRMAIAKRQFEVITFDIRQFDFSLFSSEFSNSRTFRATLLFLEKNPDYQSDGSSWLQYIKNKFKTKSSFPNGIRPKPWILEVTKAWIPPGWPWNPNPAVTQMEEFFLTFGYLGLILGMIMVGFWASFLDFSSGNPLYQAFRIICIALLFQWTTRGFFLHQLQISLVCIFPLAVLYLIKPYLPHGSVHHKA